MVVGPSTTPHDAPFVVDTATLLAAEQLGVTPSSDMPIREGSRDAQSGCLMCGGPRPRPARDIAPALASNALIGSAIKPPTLT